MSYGGHFDPDSKNKRINELESEMLDGNFWNDKEHSESVVGELNNLKNTINGVSQVKNEINDALELIEMLKLESNDDVKKELENSITKLEDEVSSLEINLLLSGEYDKCDAIIDIHPGAGGTESCDWASMLYRMYTRWCEKHNYKVEVVDYQDGEEAGIKSVSMIVKGINSYGYLKNEKGVHRLIRISPFDSNKRRHTSFASVDVTPVYENSDFSIDPNDIRIDIYRASGHGGQGVNTTDSAIRITHIPTKIVVTCQNERSQIRNKETAMNVLKNKLYKLELEKREKELNSIKGENLDINFGSQIRTYTLHPYSLVKDHRTNTEVSDPAKVLDGDIDVFISANLKNNVK